MISVSMILAAAIPVMIFTALLYSSFYLALFRKATSFRILFLYSFSQAIGILITQYLPPVKGHMSSWILFNFFLVSEFFCLLYYLRKLIRSDQYSRWLMFVQQLFPLFFIYCLLYDEMPGTIWGLMFCLHHILLFVACLTYYQEIFVTPPDIPLLRHPDFLAVAGIASTSLVSIVCAIWIFMHNHSYHAIMLVRVSSVCLLSICFLIALKFHFLPK